MARRKTDPTPPIDEEWGNIQDALHETAYLMDHAGAKIIASELEALLDRVRAVAPSPASRRRGRKAVA